MSQTPSPWLTSWTFRILAAATIAIVVVGVWGRESAFAQRDKPSLSAEDRGREVTNLKQAFGSAQIDLYFEMGELESQKPGLTGVKFVDVVDVTGKELLRFERSGDSWLIDPDTVFAYRLHKSK